MSTPQPSPKEPLAKVQLTPAERNKKWRQAHPERHAARQREWSQRDGNGYRVTKKYRENNPEKFREAARTRHLKGAYGITLEQWQKMFDMGNRACWICKKSTRKDGKPMMLHTDHDHVTGRVRGILCFHCNTRVIGRHRFGTLLLAGAAYLDSDFDGRTL